MEGLIAALRDASSVLVLTGSGISAESGLPTFRGVGGLWRTHRVEELASPEGFERDPVLVWTWYNERKAAHSRALPNAGHIALAQLENLVPDFTLATQNVDSLHLRAGSRNVVELHGNLRETRCTRCGGASTAATKEALRSTRSSTTAAAGCAPTSFGLARPCRRRRGRERERQHRVPKSSSSLGRARSSIPQRRWQRTIIRALSSPKSIRKRRRSAIASIARCARAPRRRCRASSAFLKPPAEQFGKLTLEAAQRGVLGFQAG